MKVKELIAELQQQPQENDVIIFDWMKNAYVGGSEPSSVGIIEKFAVTYDEEVFGEPITVISFDSEDFEQVEEGEDTTSD